jgi:phytoene dehydrogenase-like protein
VERFAPGFRDLILARSVRTAAEMESYNPNYIGGDINSGAGSLKQTVFRPALRWNPYRTALPGVYLCSASTSPGGGVHGMCGLGAAQTALGDLRGS